MSTLSPREDDLARYADVPEVAALGWPLEVVEQWLFDHLESGVFLFDYGHVDLSAIVWRLVNLPTADYLNMPTGEDGRAYFERVPSQHEHWTSVRRGVPEAWAEAGTWLRPPLVLARALIDPPSTGWQVVEGRTRVGILRGRVADGLHVAQAHAAWVGGVL